jgi:7-cyano-7-deazaguanine synthase
MGNAVVKSYCEGIRIMPNQKAVVLLSGGMDSATLLYYLLDQKWDVHALSVHYGQRHSRELIAATDIARAANIQHEIVDLRHIKRLLKGSSQTDDVPVPEGHYEDPSMKVTVVPNRNMILLSLAAAMAIGIGAKTVAYAAHAGDHAIYPDCRPEFVGAMRTVMELCHYDGGVELRAPFLHLSKATIVKTGLRLKVPYESTYTCYSGRERPDGTCGTCVERLEAFKLAGATDPVEYEAKETK